ncbi:MAG: CRISPR-associated helicase Cas3' [Bacillota bacterium]
MTDISWPVWLDDVWAKSPSEEGKPGEGMAAHTWEVLKRLSELIFLRPNLPEMVGFPGLWDSLFWACWLHDFGKAARGFQQCLRDGPRWLHRHEVLSLAFIDWLREILNPEEAQWAAAGIVFHHKDAAEIALRYLGPDESSAEALDSLTGDVGGAVLEGLWRWTAECSPAWIEALDLAGSVRTGRLVSLDEALTVFRRSASVNIRRRLLGLRRWERELGCEKSLVIGALALRGHMTASDHTASAHAGSFLRFPSYQPDELLTRWRLPKNKLYSHQAACLQAEGSAVLIAPTGSGKTEAALLWACSQSYSKKPLPRLFYTLPYQASMNAMYDRLRRKSFPDLVGLEHSRSMLALYRRFLEDEYDRREATRQARWAANLSRLHFFPVRVLSPYQMLKAPYRLKGYEALLTDFFEAAFIFDEVHAYEAKRLAAILSTVKYLRINFGARFFVMSATLPGLLQSRLAEALGSAKIIKATPEVFTAFQRHRLLVQEGEVLEESWLERILREALEGRSVLVCCNTVKRAQQAYGELSRRLNGRGEVVLLHGRFNGRDRLTKERLIQEATGSRSAGRRPVVLVATQVVEVSLDIDLDTIYSDPAPLEALIQRFGRINRRSLKEWAPVNVFTEPADGQQIYEADLVQRSLEVLKRNAERMIDEAGISGWLDEIYQGEVAARWNAAYQEAYEDFEAACLKTLRPFNSNDSLEEMFYRAFDSIEVLPACLEDEYETLIVAGEPLEASQLFVPLSWGQFCKLRQNGLVREGWEKWVKVVEAPYSSELGLQAR